MTGTSSNSVRTLIVVGASTRAAAMSALRGGWTPWCADLFADADLERIAPVRKIPADRYPEGLLDALKDAPLGPVMYTGGLENRPDLIARIDRPLLGNPAEVLRAVRKPELWARCLRDRRIPCPMIADDSVTGGKWLVKPRRGAGGTGIQIYSYQPLNARTHFLQERIDGESCSAIFNAAEDDVVLVGVSKQLIWTPWLNARRFQYAGSIGPIACDAALTHQWAAIGAALHDTFPLRGLFGVDAILRDGVVWPVEINPRYTASVEVFERSNGVALLGPPGHRHAKPLAAIWGKAILFARCSFAFPIEGPWLESLADGVNLDELEYADIPHAGELIEQGHPVLTIFASAPTVDECEVKLREKAQALDRRLWG